MVTKNNLRIVTHALIISCSNYCDSFFTCFSKFTANRLQLEQHAAAMNLIGISKRAHLADLIFVTMVTYFNFDF